MVRLMCYISCFVHGLLDALNTIAIKVTPKLFLIVASKREFFTCCINKLWAKELLLSIAR